MLMTCTRTIEWDCGHRVYEHAGKCKHPHGHRYKAEITAKGYSHLDRLGMVVDFSVLKDVYGTWVNDCWDHGFLAYKEDVELIQALNQVPESKVYVCEFNPTVRILHIFWVHIHFLCGHLKIFRLK